MPDTIVACATPLGCGGVAVVRLSGPLARAFAQSYLKQPLVPRQATFGRIHEAGRVLDEGLFLYFPAPHSYTGEDVLEFQGHGSPILVERVIAHWVAKGCRLAEPGEFTQRAFVHEKMDLAQAEAVADLIAARSDQAAEAAMASLQGQFSQAVYEVVDALIALRVYVESALDFPDEDIDWLEAQDLEDRLNALCRRVDDLLQNSEQGERLQAGVSLAIVGPPNAGKSSLMNALTGEETAIVTEEAGTTRDVIRAQVTLHGVPLQVVDTAGIRSTDHRVEAEGIRRAYQAAAQADWVVLLLDASALGDEDEEALWERYAPEIPASLRHRALIVANKRDLVKGEGKDGLPMISVKDGELGALLDALAERMGQQAMDGTVWSARARHVRALRQAQAALAQAWAVLREDRAGELVAEELLAAQRALDTITGRLSADDLLGEIFSQFCIGK